MTDAAYAIQRVDTIDCSFDPRPWPFAIEHAAAIDAHWRRTLLEKPKLFNGKVLLQHEGGISASILRGRYFETDFKSFMAWRAFGIPDGQVRNGFALAALRAADGAFIVGEMAAHTASAGRVYFPGGTPDPQDVRDGKVDLAGSVLRELFEETGLAPDEVTLDAGWTVLTNARHVACIKVVRSPDDAKPLADRIHKTLAAEAEPELARVHIIRSLADCAHLPLADFMIPFLRMML